MATLHSIILKATAVLGVGHDCLCRLLEYFSLQHGGAAADAGTALSQLLANIKEVKLNLTSIPSLGYDCNVEKFIDKNGDLKQRVDIKDLDITVLYDLLNYVDDFIISKAKRSKANCKGPNHTKCCQSCCHKCSECKRRTCEWNCCMVELGKCNHVCRHNNCGMTKVECDTEYKPCCKKCLHCRACALKHNTVCEIRDLRNAVELIKNLRNAVAHLIKQDEELISNGQIFYGVPNCRTWEEIWEVSNNAIEEIVTHLSNNNQINSSDVKTIIFNMEHIKRKSESDTYKEFKESINNQIKGFMELDCQRLERLLATAIKKVEDNINDIKEDVKKQLHMNIQFWQTCDISISVFKDVCDNGIQSNFSTLVSDVSQCQFVKLLSTAEGSENSFQANVSKCCIMKKLAVDESSECITEKSAVDLVISVEHADRRKFLPYANSNSKESLDLIERLKSCVKKNIACDFKIDENDVNICINEWVVASLHIRMQITFAKNNVVEERLALQTVVNCLETSTLSPIKKVMGNDCCITINPVASHSDQKYYELYVEVGIQIFQLSDEFSKNISPEELDQVKRNILTEVKRKYETENDTFEGQSDFPVLVDYKKFPTKLVRRQRRIVRKSQQRIRDGTLKIILDFLGVVTLVKSVQVFVKRTNEDVNSPQYIGPVELQAELHMLQETKYILKVNVDSVYEVNGKQVYKLYYHELNMFHLMINVNLEDGRFKSIKTKEFLVLRREQTRGKPLLKPTREPDELYSAPDVSSKADQWATEPEQKFGFSKTVRPVPLARKRLYEEVGVQIFQLSDEFSKNISPEELDQLKRSILIEIERKYETENDTFEGQSDFPVLVDYKKFPTELVREQQRISDGELEIILDFLGVVTLVKNIQVFVKRTNEDVNSPQYIGPVELQPELYMLQETKYILKVDGDSVYEVNGKLHKLHLNFHKKLNMFHLMIIVNLEDGRYKLIKTKEFLVCKFRGQHPSIKPTREPDELYSETDVSSDADQKATEPEQKRGFSKLVRPVPLTRAYVVNFEDGRYKSIKRQQPSIKPTREPDELNSAPDMSSKADQKATELEQKRGFCKLVRPVSFASLKSRKDDPTLNALLRTAGVDVLSQPGTRYWGWLLQKWTERSSEENDHLCIIHGLYFLYFRNKKLKPSGGFSLDGYRAFKSEVSMNTIVIQPAESLKHTYIFAAKTVRKQEEWILQINSAASSSISDISGKVAFYEYISHTDPLMFDGFSSHPRYSSSAAALQNPVYGRVINRSKGPAGLDPTEFDKEYTEMTSTREADECATELEQKLTLSKSSLPVPVARISKSRKEIALNVKNPTNDDILTQSAYLGELSRLDCENVLKTADEGGTYAIRRRSLGGNVLSVLDEECKSVKHFIIFEENGKVYLDVGQKFNNIHQLIRHYHENDLAGNIRLKLPLRVLEEVS